MMHFKVGKLSATFTFVKIFSYTMYFQLVLKHLKTCVELTYLSQSMHTY